MSENLDCGINFPKLLHLHVLPDTEDKLKGQYWMCLVVHVLKQQTYSTYPTLEDEQGLLYGSGVRDLRVLLFRFYILYIKVPCFPNTPKDSCRQLFAWCSDLDGCQLAPREPQGHGLSGWSISVGPQKALRLAFLAFFYGV